MNKTLSHLNHPIVKASLVHSEQQTTQHNSEHDNFLEILYC